MLNSIKSLVVVLFVMIPILMLAKPLMAGVFISPAVYRQRAKILVGVTVAAFLGQDFWIFFAVASSLVYLAAKKDGNPVALYLLLIMAVPPMARNVPGFGLINYIMSMDYLKILSISILLPVAISIRSRPQSYGESRQAYLADWFVLGFFVLKNLLYFRYTPLTETLRGAVIFGLDVWLPYYVMSRYFTSMAEVKEALAAFALAAIIAAALAVPETILHWSFYQTIQQSLKVEWGLSVVMRGDSFRSQGSTGQPIALGFALCVGLGFWMYVKRFLALKWAQSSGLLVLVAGMIATFSRGPWVGAVATIVTFIALAPGAGRRLVMWVSGIGIVSVLVLASPYGDMVMSYLPFTKNNVDSGSSEYRARLFEISISILDAFPLFGTPYFYSYMEELRQGQGIIDLVNTYLAIALPTGYVGLAIWVTPLLLAVAAAAKVARGSETRQQLDLRYLAAALGGTLVGAMVIIGTVSPVGVVPHLMWILVGLSISVATLDRNSDRVGLRPISSGFRS